VSTPEALAALIVPEPDILRAAIAELERQLADVNRRLRALTRGWHRCREKR
jgi:hypothetical protein